MKQIDIVYFAWVRERIGFPKEQITTNAETVQELVTELSSKEQRYQLAFQDMNVIRVAVDQEIAPLDTPLNGVKEVAFFPPMTGG